MKGAAILEKNVLKSFSCMFNFIIKIFKFIYIFLNINNGLKNLDINISKNFWSIYKYIYIFYTIKSFILIDWICFS
jgi:hypothetical protein